MDGNFFASLHEKYEENASQWSLDFTQQDFFISGESIQNLDLIEMMEKVRKMLQGCYALFHSNINRALLTGFWGKLFRVCPSNDPEPSITIFSK